jgi:eukaryotic-like serine/threonine-protein kinase
MKDCPTSEQLAGLLADGLSPDERDSVAEHVDGCIPCQEQLARMTNDADTQIGHWAEPASPGSADEERAVRQLKQRPPASLTWPGGRCGSTIDNASAAQWLAVPGYEIVRELGRGGMGIVYEARQLALPRTVALKMLLAGEQARAKDLARFRAEAEVLARLQHPNIVQIYDVGEAAGRPFLALEFVAGGSLARYLDGKPQPVQPAARLVETLARAVHAAHTSGVVHRDLKPANILLHNHADVRGKNDHEAETHGFAPVVHPLSYFPKISDFGLAKLFHGDGQTNNQRGPTLTGEVLGTPNYMAPEQATTRRRPVGPPADVYALGAILYELLTGRPPFTGNTPLEIVIQVVHNEPVSVTRLQANVPRDLETICHKCLDKEPRKRYASALELADDLLRFLQHEPIRARPPSTLYQWGKFAQRNKGLVLGLAGILAALTLGGLAAGLFGLRETQERHRADQEKEAALHQAYYAHLAAAGAALRDDDVAAARRHLDASPRDLRNWEWRHLASRLDDSATLYRAPDQNQLLLAFGWNELRLFEVGRDDLRLFNPDGDTLLSLPRKDINRVNHVEQTPQGMRIIAYDKDGSPVVLDQRGNIPLHLEGAPPGCQPDVVAVNQGQTRLLVEWWGNALPPSSFTLYDLASGKKGAVFAGHKRYIRGLALSPDGKLAASGSEDHTARLWDTATGTLLHELQGHNDKVWAVAFAPDGKRVVTGSADGTLRQWDTATGAPVGIAYRGHHDVVRSAVYSPDGRWIASGGRDGTVRLWQAEDHKDVAIFHGHTESVIQIAFSRDGRRLVSLADDRTARTWEVETGSSPVALGGHSSYVYPVAYSPDGLWIASGSWDGTVRLWDAHTDQPCAALKHSGVLRALAFGPDGSWLVTACDGEDQLQIWNVATGLRQRQIKSPGNCVMAVTVSPDGSRIAAVARGGRVGIMDAGTGQEVASFQMSGEWTEKKALVYSPDGRWLAGAGEDLKNIDLWDTQTYTRSAQLVGHTGAVNSVSFSRDAQRLASGSDDKTVRIWDVATRTCLKVLPGHTDQVLAAIFSRDGTRVASGGRDRAILLWDAATAVELMRLQGHTNYVYSLAFSPDGATLASGSGDCTVRLWDTVSLAERLHARREADAQFPQAEQLVEQLFKERWDASEVARAVWFDPALTSVGRRAAQRAIWRRLAPAE